MKNAFSLVSSCLISSLLVFESSAAENLSIEKAALISYPTERGKQYQLEASTNAADTTSWKLEGTLVKGDGRKVNITVPTSADRQFYRLREQGERTLTEAKKSQINFYLTNVINQYEIPGIIAGVKIGDQETWITSRGVSNLETKEPLGTDYRFRIGSASKTFVAMTTLQLIKEGKLQLDEPIVKYLSQAETNALSKYNVSQISIRMLLEHTSGIQNYTDNIDDWFVPYINNRTRVWTDLELLKAANAVGDPYATPGATWWYSNSNYILLGIITEKITGRTIREEVTSRWIQPLQLTNTFYPAPGESTIPGDKIAHGYMDWQNFLGFTNGLPPGLLDVTVYDPSGVGAAGPMISTCDDLLRWMYAIGHGEALIGRLSSGHIDWNYFRALIAGGNATSLSYGMGIAHENDPVNNANYYVVGHRGQISGFDTAMQYLPEQDTTIVVVCTRSLKNGPNFPTNSNLVALNYIVNLLYPELISASKVTTSAVPESYRPATKELSLRSTQGTSLKSRLEANRDQIKFPLVEYP